MSIRIQGIRIVDIPTMGMKSNSAIRKATVTGLGTDAASIRTVISPIVISMISEYEARYLTTVLMKLVFMCSMKNICFSLNCLLMKSSTLS